MKKLLLLFSLLVISFSVFGAIDRVDVSVKLKNGDTVEGLLEVNETYPWKQQKAITIIDKSQKGQKKIKSKYKTKYRAKDVISYRAGEKNYETLIIKIKGTGKYGSGKLIAEYAMVEVEIKGAISMYKGYASPPTFGPKDVTLTELYKDLRDHPEYFLMKEEDPKTLTSLSEVNIKNWIKDAPVVEERYENGDYGNTLKSKKKPVKTAFKRAFDRINPYLFMTIITDYNKEKSKKDQ